MKEAGMTEQRGKMPDLRKTLVLVCAHVLGGQG